MTTQTLQQLVHDASTWPLPNAVAEGQRIMQICNACRYCEGFCAVFPAMTRRLDFTVADMHHLANLCHNCGACLHACQYAPPHEFAVNVPKTLARVRANTYQDYAWPAALGGIYRRSGLAIALALAAGLAVFLLLAAAGQGPLWQAYAAGNFYAVFPHNLMVSLFGPVFLFALFALGMGLSRFWRNLAPPALNRPAVVEASHNALRLTYLDGGHGEGCHNEDDRWTHSRKWFHHATFYGFALCFASTSVATLYHYVLGQPAPYAYTSLPVLLGTVGGVGLLVGPAGLFWLKLRRHPEHGDPSQNAPDYAFIALLFWVSLTGLALLLWRSSPAMPTLLCVHLAAVLALFITTPYSKMAHGFYRSAALLKHALERRLPNPVGLKNE